MPAGGRYAKYRAWGRLKSAIAFFAKVDGYDGTGAGMFRFLQKRSDSYLAIVLSLIGHLFSTASIFLSYFFLVWGISFVVDFINSIRPLPVRILEYAENFELYLIYGDSITCAAALVVATFNFISGMLGRRK